MATNILPITTVIDISVSQGGAALQAFNINNLAIISAETPLNSVPAAGYFVYQDTQSVLSDWGIASETYAQAVAIFSQSPNPLSGGGQLIVYVRNGTDALLVSITALRALVYAGGILVAGYQPSNADFLAAGADAVANNYLIFAPTNLTTDLQTGGLGLLAIASSLKNLRVLYYGVSAVTARKMAAGYAGRALSTSFGGSNTTSTMELKRLVGIAADPTVTLAVYNDAQAAGVDVYSLTAASNLPVVRTSGANEFFDNVYNLIWFKGQVQVAAFNALATTSTKIPQTEAGMYAFKRPMRDVCAQAVVNGFVAPGQWDSPDTFGDPVTFNNNINTFGYFLYSVPVAKQSPADRVARKAPLVQIAIKFAGAIQSGAILININA